MAPPRKAPKEVPSSEPTEPKKRTKRTTAKDSGPKKTISKEPAPAADKPESPVQDPQPKKRVKKTNGKEVVPKEPTPKEPDTAATFIIDKPKEPAPAEDEPQPSQSKKRAKRTIVKEPIPEQEALAGDEVQSPPPKRRAKKTTVKESVLKESIPDEPAPVVDEPQSPPPPPPPPKKKAAAKKKAPTKEPSVEEPVATENETDKPMPPLIKEKTATKESSVVTKKARQLPQTVQLPTQSGKLMVCGMDTDTNPGVLGLRKHFENPKRRPVPVPDVTEPVCLAVCGPVHSIAVNDDGSKTWTFGCNDEGALGRVLGKPENEDEDAEAIPALINIPEKVVKVTAGDSHSVALTETGAVYIWGMFRGQPGRIGLTTENRDPVTLPILLPGLGSIMDIASGDNHVLLLTSDGKVFSFGDGEQGQLGRLSEEQSKIVEREETDGSKTFINRDDFLIPQPINVSDIKAIWATPFGSFFRTSEGSLLACGLNNFGQLGFSTTSTCVYAPQPVDSLSWPQLRRTTTTIVEVAGGQLHTIFLDSRGRVYSCGSHHYGRLGLGKNLTDAVTTPQLITNFRNLKVAKIAASGSQSFAVTGCGKLFSWGQGSSHLGHSASGQEDFEDIFKPTRVKTPDARYFLSVAAGSEHILTIIKEAAVNGH